MQQPPIRLSRHAKNRLRVLRRDGFNLTPDDVLDLVIYAHHHTPTDKGRTNAWTPAPHGEWWCVTYRQENDTTLIITIFLRERGPIPEELTQ